MLIYWTINCAQEKRRYIIARIYKYKVQQTIRSNTEAVKCAARALECVDNVKSSDGLSLCVFSVCHRVTNDLEYCCQQKFGWLDIIAHIFEESLENTTSLLVDQTRDTLDTTTASKTTNSGLGDTLDVIAQDFPVTLSSSLSESLKIFMLLVKVNRISKQVEQTFPPFPRPLMIVVFWLGWLRKWLRWFCTESVKCGWVSTLETRSDAPFEVSTGTPHVIDHRVLGLRSPLHSNHLLNSSI